MAQWRSPSTHSYVALFGPISENLTGMVMINVSHKFWRFCFRLLGKEIVLQQGSNSTSEQMDAAFPRFDQTKTTADMTEIIKTG